LANLGISGNVTLSATVSIGGNKNLYCAGNFYNNAGMVYSSSPVTISMTGSGILACLNYGTSIRNPFFINTSGSVTFGSTVTFDATTFNYTTGTVNAYTNTSNFVQFTNAVTVNAAGMTFYNYVNYYDNNMTLSSGMAVSNIWLYRGDPFFSYVILLLGGYPVTVGTWQQNSGIVLSCTAGTTIVVNNALNMGGIESATGTGSFCTLESITGSSPIYLNYKGSPVSCFVNQTSFVDVTSTGNPVFDYSAGTLTRSPTIVNALLPPHGFYY
jgi:hypothetical protein